MFFSYYDSYWNDSFILEQYESDVAKIRSSQLYASFSGSYESPGVRNLEMNETISSLKNKIKQSGITDENSTLFKEALDKAIMSEVTALSWGICLKLQLRMGLLSLILLKTNIMLRIKSMLVV